MAFTTNAIISGVTGVSNQQVQGASNYLANKGAILTANNIPQPLTVSIYGTLKNSLLTDVGPLPQFYRSATIGGRTYGHDHAGRVFRAQHGECVFYGARRVENLLTYSSDFTNAAWAILAGATVATVYNSDHQGPRGLQNAFLLTRAALGTSGLHRAGGSTLRAVRHVFSIYVKSGASSAVEIQIYNNTGASVAATQTVTTTGSWKRISVPVTPDGTSSYIVRVFPISQASTSTGSVYIADAMLEEKLDGSDAPSEFVSRSEFPVSRYWHGAGVDAVKYFNTAFANTVSSGVVTETTGSALTNVMGVMTYPSAIQQILNNDVASGWTATNCTLTDNAAVAPDGTTTAISINEGAGAGVVHHAIRTLTGLTATATTAAFDDGDGGGSQTRYCFTVYLKAGTGTWMRLLVASSSATNYSGYFNPATGATGAVTTGSYLYTETLASGWYRVMYSVPFYDGSGAADPVLRISMAVGGTGVAGDVIYNGTSRVNYFWMPCVHSSTSTTGGPAQRPCPVPANLTSGTVSTLPGQAVAISVRGELGVTDFAVASTYYPYYRVEDPNKQRYSAVTYLRTEAPPETRSTTVGDLDIQRTGLTIRPPLNNSTGSFALDFYNGDPNPDYFWAPGTTYSVGDYVIPRDTKPNNDNGRKIFTCVIGGVSGGSDPPWDTTYTAVPDTTSNITPDNTVSWQCNVPNDINGTWEPYSGEILDLALGFLGSYKCAWYVKADDYGLFINGAGGTKQTYPRPTFPSKGYTLDYKPKTLYLGGLGVNSGQYPEAVPSGQENAMMPVHTAVHCDVIVWASAPNPSDLLTVTV